MALRGGSETRVLSRNKKDLGGKFPEAKDSIAALDVRDAMIDGEIVAPDEKGPSSFQLLQAFAMGQERPPIVFYAFDLLRVNSKELRNLSIEERKAKFEELLKKPPGVIRYSVSFTKDIEELLSRTRELGLEGLLPTVVSSGAIWTEIEPGFHIELKTAVPIDVFPDKRRDGAQIRWRQPAGPVRKREHLLHHEGVNINHAVPSPSSAV